MKRLLAVLHIALISYLGVGAASADDRRFDMSPSEYREAVGYFLEDRLYDARSARINIDSAPYPVFIETRRGLEAHAWAVDVLVKSRLPSGSWSNYQSYTVIFHNGVPVAFDTDLRNIRAI